MVDLSKPLEWKKAEGDEQLLLENLQGNIVKGHGRDITVNLFIRFTDQQKAKRLLRTLANYHITNALQQLVKTEEFKNNHIDGGSFAHLSLSHFGYKFLGFDSNKFDDRYFIQGMKNSLSQDAIHDDINLWEPDFNKDIHAFLLLAHDNETNLNSYLFEINGLLAESESEILKTQKGKAIKNKADIGIEHFGYVDGRSQPLLLVESINNEAETAGTSQWNPAFGLDIALVPDPLVDSSQQHVAHGSYFIFRKLEQSVRAFKTAEQGVADSLGLSDGEERELAGAYLVGRFEDGTPVTLSDEAENQVPPNNFNYENDNAARCPYHGHIRSVNDRKNRDHIMVRRGIPYEDIVRDVLPKDLPEAGSVEEFEQNVQPLLPENGVGLLFMAYNSNIEKQFIHTQQLANGGIGKIPLALDPIIGQGNNSSPQNLPFKWDDLSVGAKSCPFKSFVTTRGGEYFFSPSLKFLREL